MPSPTLTIDLLATVLYRTLLHPFLAWLVPLTLRAQATPYTHRSFQFSVIYAILVTLLRLFFLLDARLASGPPRELHWEDEVVVITGGCGGLGGLVAEVYGMRGIGVAVLDIKEEGEVEKEWRAKGCRYYTCDVGDRNTVEDVGRRIEKDLGTPTILINNAGIVNGKRFMELTAEEIVSILNLHHLLKRVYSFPLRTYRVNLLSHYHTIQTFLPGMLRRPHGGTIVTVSSVLGYLGSASLSDYTSSKAALTALHHSLAAELSLLSTTTSTLPTTSSSYPSQIRTILLTPGQIHTPLFSHITPPSPFLGPILDPSEVAAAIIKAIDSGTNAEIALPLYARWIGWLGVLPAGCKGLARRWAGLDWAAWEGFRRRREGR